MSLLIEGMNMPKNGRVTIDLASEETGTNIIARITDDKTGKLIEHKGVVVIPTPHGRLIDADKAATAILMMSNHPCGHAIETVSDVVDWLRIKDNNIAFPTIIEAEGNQ